MRCLAFLLAASFVSAADTKPFLADFKDAKVGSLPKGWTAAITGEGKVPAWKIVEDKTAPKGTRTLVQSSVSPNLSYNLCVADGTSFKDVEVSVSWRALAGRPPRIG